MTASSRLLYVGNRDALDDDVVERTVTGVAGYLGELVDNLAACLVLDRTEDGVLTLEPIGCSDGDEELRTVGSLSTNRSGVCHSEHVRLVEVQVRVDLIIELVAGATRSIAERVAALDHKAGDDAVEDNAVVEGRSLLRLTGLFVCPVNVTRREADEVLHRLGCMVTEQVDLDFSVVGVKGGDSGVLRHIPILTHPPTLSGGVQAIRWQDGDLSRLNEINGGQR